MKESGPSGLAREFKRGPLLALVLSHLMAVTIIVEGLLDQGAREAVRAVCRVSCRNGLRVGWAIPLIPHERRTGRRLRFCTKGGADIGAREQVDCKIVICAYGQML